MSIRTHSAQPVGALGKRRGSKGEQNMREKFQRRGKGEPTFVQPKLSCRASADDNSSPQTPQALNPSPERDAYDEENEEVFQQAPNPPLPKASLSPYSSSEGISGRAAAIAYLRIRGWADRGRKKTFYAVLAWILRHSARELGFQIVPDGFVRITDLVRFFLFENRKKKKADSCFSLVAV
jgi:hypothetical protein